MLLNIFSIPITDSIIAKIPKIVLLTDEIIAIWGSGLMVDFSIENCYSQSLILRGINVEKSSSTFSRLLNLKIFEHPQIEISELGLPILMGS